MSTTLSIPWKTPQRPAWSFGPYCELLDVKPTRTVRISVDAACAIQNEVEGFYERSLYGLDEETGGPCMGPRQLPDSDIVITVAGGPGADSETGYGWFRRGVETQRQLHRAHHDTKGLVRVAAYHSHPPGYSAQPSRADLRAWQFELELAREAYGRQVHEWVGLIVANEDRREPKLTAWIVTDRGDDFATAEPANLALMHDTVRAPRRRRGQPVHTPTYHLEPTYGEGGIVTETRISENTFERSDGTIMTIPKMLVASRSYTAEYDGEQIQIRAGVSRVAVSHELAHDSRGGWMPAGDGP